ncbi:MAG: class I SAM-dependent methyltransferase [Archangium sp.]|nr:class I SAM-dependent methyltransferase [Archangium sp.]MDP3571246.1 class I SAM-dependent methyltransferase [Archangium sp.]
MAPRLLSGRTVSGPFFGELYLRSTRPFLSDVVTEAEARFLRTNLPEGRLLDLGCGHGRHLAQVPAFGIDRDPLSLAEAKTFGPVVRGDFRALPYRTASFRGAWCWYNSMGTFEDDQVPLILAELSRCVAPGGALVIQGSHLDRAIAQPEAGYDGPLPDGSHLKERAVFNPQKKRDEIHRSLQLPDGRLMEAPFFIRYYDLEEWRGLLAEAGFEVAWSVGGLDGAPLNESSTDVIVGAKKSP